MARCTSTGSLSYSIVVNKPHPLGQKIAQLMTLTLDWPVFTAGVIRFWSFALTFEDTG